MDNNQNNQHNDQHGHGFVHTFIDTEHNIGRALNDFIRSLVHPTQNLANVVGEGPDAADLHPIEPTATPSQPTAVTEIATPQDSGSSLPLSVPPPVPQGDAVGSDSENSAHHRDVSAVSVPQGDTSMLDATGSDNISAVRPPQPPRSASRRARVEDSEDEEDARETNRQRIHPPQHIPQPVPSPAQPISISDPANPSPLYSRVVYTFDFGFGPPPSEGHTDPQPPQNPTPVNTDEHDHIHAHPHPPMPNFTFTIPLSELAGGPPPPEQAAPPSDESPEDQQNRRRQEAARHFATQFLNAVRNGEGMEMGGGAGGMFPFPFPLPGMFDREERDDPERAKRLLAGLDEVPVGLVQRMERVGGPGTAEGDAPGCAVCWDKLLEPEGDVFEAKKADEPSEASSNDSSGDAPMDIDVPQSVEMSSTAIQCSDTSVSSSVTCREKKYPKIVALPCSHVFHESCLLPWFSRPHRTTCPTCRFDIDPESLTYIPHVPRARRPASQRTEEGTEHQPPAGTGEANLQPTAAAAEEGSLPSAPQINLSENLNDAGVPTEPTPASGNGAMDTQPQPNPNRRLPPAFIALDFSVFVPVHIPHGAPPAHTHGQGQAPLPSGGPSAPGPDLPFPGLDADGGAPGAGQNWNRLGPEITRRMFHQFFAGRPPMQADVGHSPQAAAAAGGSVSASQPQAAADGPTPPQADNAGVPFFQHLFNNFMNEGDAPDGEPDSEPSSAAGSRDSSTEPSQDLPPPPPFFNAELDPENPDGAAASIWDQIFIGLPPPPPFNMPVPPLMNTTFPSNAAGGPAIFMGPFNPHGPVPPLMARGHSRQRPPEKRRWTLPPPPGPTLRQRIERKECEMGIRCWDVSCGIGPSDEDPFPVVDPTEMRQIHIRPLGQSGVEGAKECGHTFHPSCLVSAERVAGWGQEDKKVNVEGEEVEISCPVCRSVGCVPRVDWDEGACALA